MTDIRRYVLVYWQPTVADTVVHVAAYSLDEAKEQGLLEVNGFLPKLGLRLKVIEPYEESLHGPWLGRGGQTAEPKAAKTDTELRLRAFVDAVRTSRERCLVALGVEHLTLEGRAAIVSNHMNTIADALTALDDHSGTPQPKLGYCFYCKDHPNARLVPAVTIQNGVPRCALHS